MTGMIRTWTIKDWCRIQRGVCGHARDARRVSPFMYGTWILTYDWCRIQPGVCRHGRATLPRESTTTRTRSSLPGLRVQDHGLRIYVFSPPFRIQRGVCGHARDAREFHHFPNLSNHTPFLYSEKIFIARFQYPAVRNPTFHMWRPSNKVFLCVTIFEFKWNINFDH